MKKLSSIILMSLCGVFLTTGLFSEDTTEKHHIPIGIRAEAKELRMAHEQARAEMAATSSQEESQVNSKKKKLSSKASHAVKSLNSTTLSKSLHFTTHPGVYNNPINISPYGDVIETQDGAVWHVAYQDAYITLNWLPTDVIIITPNHAWFSSEMFRFTNQNTGDSVAVNLHLGPIYNSLYTHWIVLIDYHHGIVWLEDGTKWNMSSFDDSIVNKWYVNDTVIIGVNDGWLSSICPNILINVNMLNYAVGEVAPY